MKLTLRALFIGILGVGVIYVLARAAVKGDDLSTTEMINLICSPIILAIIVGELRTLLKSEDK